MRRADVNPNIDSGSAVTVHRHCAAAANAEHRVSEAFLKHMCMTCTSAGISWRRTDAT